MKQIPLTQGKFALVDDEDYEAITQRGKWYADRYKETFYAARNVYGRDENGKKIHYREKMHRIIMGVTDPNILIDHRNGDCLDNRRENLRESDKSKNEANSFSKGSKYTKFKGISFHKRQQKYNVRISLKNESYYFGSYSDPVQAAKIYDAAARRIFGKHARVNFPKNGEASAIR